MYSSVSPNVLPMTPDRSIEWNVYAVHSLDSMLYVDPAYDLRPASLAVETMVEIAHHGSGNRLEPIKIGEGQDGSVYRLGNIAIKRAHDSAATDEASGLSATQALVTLSTGLQRLGNQRYDAVTPHACLVTGHDAPEQTRITTMMSYVGGKTPSAKMPGLPDTGKRKSVYDAAISLCGSEPGDIYYDDAALANLKVRTRLGIVRTITKLDIWALPSFVEKMVKNPRPPYTNYRV